MHEMGPQNSADYSLGERIAVYKESREGLTLVLSLIVFTVTSLLGLTIAKAVGGLLLAFLLVGLPCGAAAVLVWHLVDRQHPRKYLVVYEDGLQIVTVQDVKGYWWAEMSFVQMTIVKYQETNAIFAYRYTFSDLTGREVLAFSSTSYPALKNGKFNRMLKRLHQDGRISLQTDTRWVTRNDD